jgi:DNA-binding NarL/FixJ family response regulator
VIRILLVDDHSALRTSLAFMINREPDMEVVGQAGTLASARQVLEGVDVAVLDLDLPDGTGTALIPDLRAADSDGHVLVLTGSENERDRAQAIADGAAAVLHKSVSIDDIIESIRRVARGEPMLSAREILDTVRFATQQREQDRAVADRFAELTLREREILTALARGLSDQQISDEFMLSRQTTASHVKHILAKLEVNSRLQAAVLAIQYGIVRLG